MPYKQSPGRMNMPKTGRDIPTQMQNPLMNKDKKGKHTGKVVEVTLKSGKKVKLDTRSTEYKSLMAARKNKNERSGVGFKDGRYTGMSESGETQM